ncbi:hypothetical protein SLS59_007165 [Nothophoma quercina]|uniref:Cytochrome P450 n=1 Tax=Nothophoma quercina TaxID=749835 RepID=A0ABR3R185_9PLEO
MLATQFKDFELGQVRRGSFAPLLGHGIFSADGKQWERARAILRPQFSRDQVSDLELEERHVQNMLRALPSQASAQSDVVDLQPLFFRLTMDSASEFLFGQSTNTQLSALSEEDSVKNAEDTEFVETFEACQHRIMMAMLLNEFYALIQTKSFMNKCRLCHRYIDKFVHKALRRHEKIDQPHTSEKQRYIFADSLAKETTDSIEIRDQLLSILIAGRDTTASFLSFLFLMLAQHPDVFNKLRTIIIEDFGIFSHPRNISFASLKACSYLQWCLNETLRLYPPVPWNSRRSTRDTSLPSGGGADGRSPIFVPKVYDVALTTEDASIGFLGLVVAASQVINIGAALAVPTPTVLGPNVEETKPAANSYNPTDAVSAVAAIIKSEGVIEKRDSSCGAEQPNSGYTVPEDGSVDAYLKSDSQLSSQQIGYLTYKSYNSYDVQGCADACDSEKYCLGFNIFFERDPKFEPKDGCANPDPVTNIKCSLYDYPVAGKAATNEGQWRGPQDANGEAFHVVIAGSNGYSKISKDLPSVTVFKTPTALSKGISAPLDNGYDTYNGMRLFNNNPYDPTLYAAACQAQTDYEKAHPDADGKYEPCNFFNSYILTQNEVLLVTYCSLYTRTWDSSYATNTGF